VTQNLPIGQLLVSKGHIDVWQLQSALSHQERWGGRLGEVIIEMRFVPEQVVMAEVARHLGVSYVDVSRVTVEPAVMSLVPAKLARSRGILPLRLTSDTRRARLVVASSAPQELAALDEIAFACGLCVQPVLAGKRAIERALDRHLGRCATRCTQGWAVELPPEPEGPMHLQSFAESVQQ
jgi:hypothetical protein